MSMITGAVTGPLRVRELYVSVVYARMGRPVEMTTWGRAASTASAVCRWPGWASVRGA